MWMWPSMPNSMISCFRREIPVSFLKKLVALAKSEVQKSQERITNTHWLANLILMIITFAGLIVAVVISHLITVKNYPPYFCNLQNQLNRFEKVILNLLSRKG